VQTDLAAALHHNWIERRDVLDVRDGVSGCRVTYFLLVNGLWFVPIVILLLNVLVVFGSGGT